MWLRGNRRFRASPYELDGQALNMVYGVDIIFSRLLPRSPVPPCQLVHRLRNAPGLCLADVVTAGCLQRFSAFFAIDVDLHHYLVARTPFDAFDAVDVDLHQSDHMDEDPLLEGVGSSRL